MEAHSLTRDHKVECKTKGDTTKYSSQSHPQAVGTPQVRWPLDCKTKTWITEIFVVGAMHPVTDYLCSWYLSCAVTC